MFNFFQTKFFSKYLPFFLTVVVIFVFVFLYSGPKKVEAGWYSSGGTWTYRKAITIDHTKVGVGTTTPLTNFPMLFSVTDPDLKFTGSGGKVASSTGLEMIFTSADGTTKIPYEMEYYASTTGQVIAWVQIPSLSPSTDTTIYVYFGGDATAYATDQSNKTGVWDANYVGVWHLKDGTTLNISDSTNINTATNSGVTATTGKVDGSGNFDGSSYIYLGNNNALQLAGSGSPFTIEFWANFNNAPVNNSGPVWAVGRYHMGGANGKMRVQDWNFVADSLTSVSTGVWQHWVGTYDGLAGTATAKMYLNGILDNSGTGAPGASGTVGVYLGIRPSFNLIDGKVDELRISNVVRTPDWIATEYNNQSSPSTFYAYGVAGIQNRSASTPGVGYNSRGASSVGWYSSGGTWTYRKAITVDHNKVATTSALTNFPMLFSVTDPDLKFTGSGGKVASSTGLEMIFTSSDGTTALSYELEKYSSTTGEVVAWVKIPTLSGVTDTTIYVYFGGNATAINTDHSDKTNVWDTNYKGVWHLPNGTSLTAKDSTSNGNNGTLSNTPTASSGQIDGAANFVAASSQSIDVGGSGTLNPSTAITISGWMKPNSTAVASTLVANSIAIFPSPGYEVFCYSDGYLYFDLSDGAGVLRLSTPCSTSWFYFSGTYDGSAQRLYINGVQQAGQVYSLTIGNPSQHTYIGYIPGFGNYMDGMIDEVRISNSARPADWIATEYNNQSSPSTFYGYSGLQSTSRLDSSAVPTPAVKSRGGIKFR